MKCPACGTEIPQGYNECFFCGKSLSQTYRPEKAKTLPEYANDVAFVVLGIVSAVIAIFVIPIVFGAIGMFAGSMIMKGHRKGLGLFIIVISFFGLTIGTLRETSGWR